MRVRATIGALAVALALGCGGEESVAPARLSVDQLRDPEACQDCHPTQYAEWSGSMHAYAADDPVFLAMNAKGQRETDGALGGFCVNCHAPMAVRTGATTDGLDLAEVPQELKGVTCYFCHTVASVDGSHNNPLSLADDGVMRGGIADPIESDAHASAYSPLHDRNDPSSASTCGACHDVVTQAGVHLERTYLEWQESLYSSDETNVGLSCGRCHMTGDRPATAADVPGAPIRFPHEHAMPGVDVALTPWPGKAQQLQLIERDLFNAIAPELCVVPTQTGTFEARYTLDNVLGGHNLPSGAAHDRRMWAEVIALDGDARLLESGVVDEGQAIAPLAASDPNLWQVRDFGLDASGGYAIHFWEIADYDSQLLPPAVTNDPTDPAFVHSVTHIYPLPSPPTRVTARVRLRPVGLDVLDDLIDSGDLDPSIRAEMPTFDLTGTVLEWTTDDGFGCVP